LEWSSTEEKKACAERRELSSFKIKKSGDPIPIYGKEEGKKTRRERARQQPVAFFLPTGREVKERKKRGGASKGRFACKEDRKIFVEKVPRGKKGGTYRISSSKRELRMSCPF